MNYLSRRLGAAVQWRVDTALARALDAYRDEQKSALDVYRDEQKSALDVYRDEQKSALDVYRDEQIVPLKRHVELLSDELWAEVAILKERMDFLRSEYDRLMPHIAALESRLADSATSRGPEDREPSSMERERERVRIQLQAISQYEERIGRLEQGLDPEDRYASLPDVTSGAESS